MTTQRFAFHFDPRYERLLRAIGVRPDSAEVRLTDTELAVDFGPWRLRTDLSNVASTTITGPYKAFRAIGPHLSLADRGVSFGTNVQQGLCIALHRPVPALDPLGVLRHPGVTVTVASVTLLAEELGG